MTEQLVIAPLIDGLVADGPLHEPAPFKKLPALPDRAGRTVYLKERIEANNGIPPYDWPAKCGVVGIVYARDGVFADREMCTDCAEAKVMTIAPDAPVFRHGTLHGYVNRKCRCASCRTAHTVYYRDYRRRKRAAA